MGEKSKKVGEIGEDIVNNFFALIGWTNPLENQTLPCKKPRKHARADSERKERKTHGIDFLFSYRSPLEVSTLESAIVSVKHTTNAYEASPKSKFKEHFTDLAQTIECHKHSELKNKQQEAIGQTTRTRDSGVLFWLSSAEDTYDDLVSKISNTRIDSDLTFEAIHIIDNKRIHFLYDSITHIRKSASPDQIKFYYPETALSYVDQSIQRQGRICPIEFLTAPIVPSIIKAASLNEQDTFCLSSIENFDEDAIQRLLQAAKEYTQGISCKYRLLFPNFIPHLHSDAVRTAILGVDAELSERVEVESYRSDFRSLSK